MVACSGSVPVLAAVTGPAISGPALLLGLADLSVMTPDAFAFVSGPDAVEGFTGMRVSLHDLGGASMHATSSGLCALMAPGPSDVLDLVGAVLGYLPDHTDAEPPWRFTDDPAGPAGPRDPGDGPGLGVPPPTTSATSSAPWSTTESSSSCAPCGPRSW